MNLLVWTKQDRGQKTKKLRLQARELSRQMGELLMLRPGGYSFRLESVGRVIHAALQCSALPGAM